MEAHRQQHLPHSEHTTTGEHEHTAQSHQHDEYPSHTHIGYTHTHPIQPEPEPEQPDDSDIGEQNTQTVQQDDVQQPIPQVDSEPEPNYTNVSLIKDSILIGQIHSPLDKGG